MSSTPLTNLPLVVPPGGGRAINAFGAEMIFHLTGEQTEGRLTLATILAPPSQGPPPHYHENEDECFLVQEGRMSFLIDGHWRDVEPGTMVFAPKRSVHTLKNIGEATARILVAISPSGFETFYARCGEEFKKTDGPDMARIVEISAEHGIHYVGPPS